jgi:predicted RNA-binding protein YlxR (DUF448 family)
MRESHVPTRLCLGCNASDRQDRLTRLGLVGGRLVWTSGRPSVGRSGYLHRSERCWEGFVSRKPFLRSLRASVDRTERARLVAQLRAAG